MRPKDVLAELLREDGVRLRFAEGLAPVVQRGEIRGELGPHVRPCGDGLPELDEGRAEGLEGVAERRAARCARWGDGHAHRGAEDLARARQKLLRRVLEVCGG